MNFDRFCHHLSITDADQISYVAVVRDLSVSDAVFKSVISNMLKDFPQVECPHEEEKDCMKIWSLEDVLTILPSGFG